MTITMTPAYGREYKSAKAAKASWYAGDDWIINDITSRWDGKPATHKEIDQQVKLRFYGLRKVCMA